MQHRHLTVFPLFWWGGPVRLGEEGSQARYRLLSEAIDAEEARVEEVDEGGRVPQLSVHNDGAIPVLIPEGEILMGAKQNRVVNLTVLVAAKSGFELPVSCVEQGRWSYRSRRFRPVAFAHPRLRDLKIKSAQAARRATGVAESDQSAVWDEVLEHLRALRAEAPTRDFVDGYAAAKKRLGDYRRKFRLPAGACGFVTAWEGRVVGLDLFDTPETMHKLWERIADAYFLEAVREALRERPIGKERAKEFLTTVADHLVPAAETPGLGAELEVEHGALSGSALWFEGAVCHLSAFASAPETAASPISENGVA
jgi:hypothetical protein